MVICIGGFVTYVQFLQQEIVEALNGVSLHWW